MNSPQLLSVAALLTTVFTASALTQDPAQPADASREVAAAGEMFEKSCAACHQVPDTRFDVERAWLTQIADTA